jgi:CheY-like chemotaxis protein
MKTILLVEDDPDILIAVGLFLESEGYSVLQAGNGMAALESIQVHGIPHLILLDMKMPVMNGWEFAEKFSGEYGGKAPIVVMTAADDAAQRARDIHAVGWIGKPFELDDILEIVKKNT